MQSMQKKTRPKRRLQLPAGLPGWMATLALIVFILYAGYLLGTGAQNGTPGLAAVTGDPYGLAYLAMMLLFANVCAVPLKRRGAVWLALPAGVYLCMTLVRLYRPLVIAVATVYAVARDSRQLPVLQALLWPLALALAPYLLQLAVLGSLLGQLWGHGRRAVHLTLCVLWPLAACANVLVYLPDGWRQAMPQLLGLLSFCGAAALLALPVLQGKRVPAAAGDAKDAAAHAAQDAPAGDAAEKADTPPAPAGEAADVPVEDAGADALSANAAADATAAAEDAPAADTAQDAPPAADSAKATPPADAPAGRPS